MHVYLYHTCLHSKKSPEFNQNHTKTRHIFGDKPATIHLRSRGWSFSQPTTDVDAPGSPHEFLLCVHGVLHPPLPMAPGASRVDPRTHGMTRDFLLVPGRTGSVAWDELKHVAGAVIQLDEQ